MTDEQYWKGDPSLVVYYREAETIRSDNKNAYEWLMGKYVFDALSIALGNAFRKKGQRVTPYISEPYQIRPKSETEKLEDRLTEQQKAIRSLNAWKSAWDKRNGQG